MKKLILFVAVGLMYSASFSQVLPKPSPQANVEQVVGVSNLSLDYSRPSAKGRTIFGDLVPYDQVWRLGANACTKFTSSTAIKIGDKKLDAGTYSMFATPSKTGEWLIAFNSDIEQGGTGNYDTKKDVASLKVKAVENTFTESLVIEFNNLTNNSGVISIQWENVRVDVPFTVNTEKLAKANIDAAIKKGENLGAVYLNAANYYYGSAKDNKTAMTFVDKAMAIETTFPAIFLKARITHANGDKEQAIRMAEEALKMAKEAESKGYADYISGTIADWKK
jgi:tetratricopeptide (TPR) repeat protein